MDFELTVPVVEDENEITLPQLCMNPSIQYETFYFKKGQTIRQYELVAPCTKTRLSELWYAKDYAGVSCVVKCMKTKPNIELMYLIQSLDSPYIATILDMGEVDGYWYEVYPFYRNGHIAGILSEETIKNIVLPGIIQALNVLHQHKIVHNDLKPQNIFWDDKKENIILGDFGNVTSINEVPPSISPAYAAPEMIMGGVGKRSADWCSVGLTLASLANGTSLISTNDRREALFLWENGVFYERKEGYSVEFQRLVNGMILSEPKKRMGPKAAGSWCNNRGIGSEGRKTEIKTVEKKRESITFTNPPIIVVDIPMLFDAIITHWEQAAFLFRQKHFDKFLVQFDRQWLDICKELRRQQNDEIALFWLTMKLTDGKKFIWRGRSYHSPAELEEEWYRGADGEENVLAFLQKGLLLEYFKEKHAGEEQLSYLKRLQASSHYHPAESMLQLFQALRGDEGFVWKEASFLTLDDLYYWLEEHYRTLDYEIEELMNSRPFAAWLSYQGMDGVIDQIRRRCGGE